MASRVQYAAGLDAGGEETRCALSAIEGRRLRLLAYASARSGGWQKGHMADQQAASASILAVAQEIEKLAGVPVESVVVGIGGASVRGGNTRGAVELGRPREVDQRDVNRAISRASHVQLQEDRMILQLFPQDFVVDDHPGHRDPRKMLASSLEVNVHVITTSIREHVSLVNAVNQAHLSVDETVYEGLAACYASVLPEDRREGVACLDIGAQSSELVVYYGDSLQLAAPIPVSGDHFTRDIVKGLRIGFEDAVRLKEQYGCALADDTPANSFVDVFPHDGSAPKVISMRVLHKILEARALDVFEQVQRELQRVAMDRALLGGVVLTGGGARLPGLCDVAGRVLNCKARCGFASGIQKWPDELSDPAWATVAGLTMYSGRLQLQSERERRETGVLGRMLR